jgi:UDP-N-acetylglucosamine acyltransferase
MATTISPLADVDPKATLGADVHIGPFCRIGADAAIGDRTRLESHVVIEGRSRLGCDNQVFAHAVIGAPPQDLSYRNGPTEVVIGDRNIIRESVTINRATEKEEGVTVLGSDCYLMAGCHVAHDCRVGHHVLMANNVLLGGHVHVHDFAVISGAVAIHHFVTVGSYSFTSGVSRIVQDVPPYMLVEGVPARPRCVNLVGLRRNGFTSEQIRALNEGFRLLYRHRAGLDRARTTLREHGWLIPQVNHLLSFAETTCEGRQGRSRDRRRAA